MKYTVTTPRIKKYALRFGPDDEVIRCTRADFNLDFDKHTVTVCSDCGTFKAQWEKAGDFIQQISNTSKKEFLDKITKRSEFDLADSKRKTAEKLEKIWPSVSDEYVDPSFALELQKIAIHKVNAKNAKDFFYKVDAITGNLLEPQQIIISMDYPDSAKIIACVFEEYFKSIL